MELFKWQNGRQGTGYQIFPIAFWNLLLKFDIYLIHYMVGSFIPPHKDPNNGGKHYRLNIELWRGEGGIFHCDEIIFKFWRFILFRPDINTHYVTQVTAGNRYVLFIGWLI